MQKQNMTPKEIVNVLNDRGISQSGLARDLNRSPSHVGRVIRDPKRSWPMACHIARALDKKPEEVWPETFAPDQPTPKVGRPLGRGLFTHKPAQCFKS
jgi:lambda repressor-like predicted transcriptional regulator